MALAELIGKLKSKKQAAERSSFGHYLATVKDLASGAEIDSDECGHVLEATGKDETDLERDVNLQQQRNAWAAQLRANQQAIADRIQAERDVTTAQALLQAAHDKLKPAVDAAHDRLNDANHRFLTTMNADAMLCGNVLDQELLQREAAVSKKLFAVNNELTPLVKDREHKSHSLANREFTLAKMQARQPGDWLPAGIVQFFNQPKDIRELAADVEDLKSQVAQLDAAIAPRQQKQRELQNELNQIYAEKLKP